MLLIPPDPEYRRDLCFTLALIAFAVELFAFSKVLEGGSLLLLVALPLAAMGLFLAGHFWLPEWVGQDE